MSKGQRKNRKTRKCEPYTEPTNRGNKIDNGTRKNKITKKCEPFGKSKKPIISEDDLLKRLKERKEWLEKQIKQKQKQKTTSQTTTSMSSKKKKLAKKVIKKWEKI